MRRWLFYIQSLSLGIMLLATIGTGIFPEEIRESFRSTINADIAKNIESPVKLAEKALEVPGLSILISAEKLKIIREEIILYRVDPVDYIKSLTGNADASKDRLQEAVKTANPAQKTILEKLIGWREKIKDHFADAFSKIVIYLTVFLITNIASLMVAIYLIRWAPQHIPHLVSTSFILTCIVGLSSFLFLDRSWTYAFIKNDFYLGSYPIGLLVAFLYVFYQYHKYRIIFKTD